MSSRRITLLTDFGTRDGYVAALKGVILARAPNVRLIDITHEIPPGDLAAAAYVLLQVFPYHAEGTVHLVVVDPGVGSDRRAVACEIRGCYFVAPDNGVLGGVLAQADVTRARQISRPELWRSEVSAVFEGRDVFAPIAAYLASGAEIDEVGDSMDPETLARAPWPDPIRTEQGWKARVIHIDHFGNLITNLPLEPDFPEGVRVAVGKREIPFVRAYHEVRPGAPLALRGSSGLLEIACHGASAAESMGATRGLVVTLRTPRRS